MKETIKKTLPILLIIAVLLALVFYGHEEEQPAETASRLISTVQIENPIQKAHRVSPVGDFYIYLLISGVLKRWARPV